MLIGTLAVVYSISAGAIGILSFDAKQAAEIWITAAQSFFAIAIIVNFEINVCEAVTLLVLFSAQVLTEFYIIRTYVDPAATELSMTVLYAFTVVYGVLGIALFVKRRESANELVRRTVQTARSALGGGSD